MLWLVGFLLFFILLAASEHETFPRWVEAWMLAAWPLVMAVAFLVPAVMFWVGARLRVVVLTAVPLGILALAAYLVGIGALMNHAMNPPGGAKRPGFKSFEQPGEAVLAGDRPPAKGF